MRNEHRRVFGRDLAAVQEVLRRWDPIGVFPNCDDGPAGDEYDSYAPQILSALYAGRSMEELADQLQALRMNHMALPARHQDLDTAKQLVGLALRAS
jgi:hypothetical protein